MHIMHGGVYKEKNSKEPKINLLIRKNVTEKSVIFKDLFFRMANVFWYALRIELNLCQVGFYFVWIFILFNYNEVVHNTGNYWMHYSEIHSVLI